ncbi:MAG: glycoside hydrolase family 16 protein [Candidatus Izimaplasma sp.]|nr:glycoside hydrolase family 16 protein [Candidatus Izimaplasma bacterium]
MKLIKKIDFTKTDQLDRSLFNVAVGEKWHNNELQAYVDKEKNLHFDNGLHLVATYENGKIESARINTKNKFSFQYGKIEMVAKIPKGRGTWPAFWMMPKENTYGHWPKSGEIDILEHTGNKKDEMFLCLHTEKYNHKRPTEQYYTSLKVDGLTDFYHTFGLIWKEDEITYLLDDKVVANYKRGEHGKDSTHKGWPFTQPYYIILNLAIGGTFGGDVDFDSFPQEFIIREINIYQ